MRSLWLLVGDSEFGLRNYLTAENIKKAEAKVKSTWAFEFYAFFVVTFVGARSAVGELE
jgi:hypothetical protein